MKIFRVLAFALMFFAVSAFADSQKRGPSNEALRLEATPSGYMVALRSLPAGTQYLDLTIKLKGYDAKQGAFLAVGLGDLYAYFDKGNAPLGEGYLVGAINECPTKGIALTVESYTAPLIAVNCKQALTLTNDMVYQIRMTVTAKGDVRVSLHAQDDTLLGVVSRPAVALAQYSKGLFVVPVGKGSYELQSMTAGSE